MEKIKITKCLFPITEDNRVEVKQPKIEGMQVITYTLVTIDDKPYEQFEFIPDNLNLCRGGNAERVGDYIHILNTLELAAEDYAKTYDDYKPININQAIKEAVIFGGKWCEENKLEKTKSE
jgi:hypothetical protein